MLKIYDYNPETGVATFKILDKIFKMRTKFENIYEDKEFIGVSKVHPEDEIVKNQTSGITIAHFKAERKRLKAKINEKEKLIKLLKAELHQAENDYNFFKERLRKVKTAHHTFVDEKEKLKKHIIRMKKQREEEMNEDRKQYTIKATEQRKAKINESNTN